MKDCEYPNCHLCSRADCDMEQKDIAAMLQRRRYWTNPELYRQKQHDYRQRIKDNLPHCDECKNCILVRKEKSGGYRRLCIDQLRLIEQKVSNCPTWCPKREHAWLIGRNDYILKNGKMPDKEETAV